MYTYSTANVRVLLQLFRYFADNIKWHKYNEN